MPDDGRADAPNETGFGNLDEATLRALIEHVPVTVYIDRLDETGSNVYTSPRLVSEPATPLRNGPPTGSCTRRSSTPRIASGS